MGRAFALLALGCALAGDQIATSARPDWQQERIEIAERTARIIGTSQAIHSVNFFHWPHCKVDEGLVLTFTDGTAKTIVSSGNLGGQIAGHGMVFRLGNADCQIDVLIRPLHPDRR